MRDENNENFCPNRDRSIAMVLLLGFTTLLFLFIQQESFSDLNVLSRDKTGTDLAFSTNEKGPSSKRRPVVLPLSSDSLHAQVSIEDGSNDVVVNIFHFNESHYYSVFAEVPEMYNIAARQVIDASTSESLEFRLALPSAFPEKDTVFTLSVFCTVTGQKSTLVYPSPFRIAVPVGQEDDIKDSLATLPPCQKSVGILFSDGVWKGPRALLQNEGNKRMRTGWTFEPSNCLLETFTSQDIKSVSKPLTIAVLGTSVQRGIFLSLVDMLTSAAEKVEFSKSKLVKCWGRAEVQIDNIRLVYQDHRIHRVDPNEDPNKIMCDGDRLSVYSGMFRNGTEMTKILLEDLHPDVVVSHYGCNPDFKPNCMSLLKKLLTVAAPRSVWNGTWVVTDYLFNGLAAIPSLEESVIHRQNLTNMVNFLNDKRIRVLDTVALSAPMELYAEGRGFIRRSQHFHGICNNSDDAIRVCSNVTEAVAQFVLGMAVAPEGKKMTAGSSNATATERILQACYDCPATLLPFHIKPLPNLTCEDGFLQTGKVGDSYQPEACPSYCMATKPIKKTQTQSGLVEVRSCNKRGGA